MYLYNVYYYAYIGVYVCVYWQHFLFGFADFSTSHLLLPVLVFDLCIFSKVPSSYSFSQHYCLSDLVPSYAPLFSRLLNTAYLSAWICAICAFWTFARKRLIRSAIWSFVHIHTNTRLSKWHAACGNNFGKKTFIITITASIINICLC